MAAVYDFDASFPCRHLRGPANPAAARKDAPTNVSAGLRKLLACWPLFLSSTLFVVTCFRPVGVTLNCRAPFEPCKSVLRGDLREAGYPRKPHWSSHASGHRCLPGVVGLHLGLELLVSILPATSMFRCWTYLQAESLSCYTHGYAVSLPGSVICTCNMLLRVAILALSMLCNLSCQANFSSLELQTYANVSREDFHVAKMMLSRRRHAASLKRPNTWLGEQQRGGGGGVSRRGKMSQKAGHAPSHVGPMLFRIFCWSFDLYLHQCRGATETCPIYLCGKGR